jgi:hypothetical protein
MCITTRRILNPKRNSVTMCRSHVLLTNQLRLCHESFCKRRDYHFQAHFHQIANSYRLFILLSNVRISNRKHKRFDIEAKIETKPKRFDFFRKQIFSIWSRHDLSLNRTFLFNQKIYRSKQNISVWSRNYLSQSRTFLLNPKTY